MARLRTLATLCAASLLATPAAAAPALVSPDGLAACAPCHRAENGGTNESGTPRLAGLPAGYLAAQLRAFADGTRADPVMTPIAQGLDAAAMTRLAAAYAAMPAPAAAPGPPPDASLASKGAMLASRGDWSRTVPPCASCHGRRGLGVGEAFPPLTGQPAAYLAAQLRAWKAGTRHDDPQGLMRVVAARLDEGEIDAVAAYYAGQTPEAGR